MTNTDKSKPLAASILSIVLASCSAQPTPIPVGTDTLYFGRIVHGEKFGVAIGQSEAEAKKVLSTRENYFSGEFECKESDVTIAFLGCKSGQHFLTFHHQQLGKTGMIILQTTNGRISQIAWSFHLLANIDL